ncbi:MAG: thioredoxin fold domain-containing protein [Acidiferrobacterales bacterium]
MKYFFFVPVFILLVSATQAADGTRDPGEHFFHQSFGDLREELQTAKSQGKKGILIMFDNDECPWCAKMKATILNQVVVQEYFRKHFIIVRVDTEGSEMIIDFTGKELQHKDFALKLNRVRATPAFLFFDVNGKQLVKYTGAARNVNEFMWLGEFVVGDHYKTKRFTIYKRERRRAAKNRS